MGLDADEPLGEKLYERVRQAALVELDRGAEPLDRISPEGIDGRRRNCLSGKTCLMTCTPDWYRLEVESFALMADG